MADLRAMATALGHADVETYIQSGNVVFTTRRADTAALAAELEQAIAAALGIRPRVVVLSREELAQVMRDNPYPLEPNPKSVHAVFLPGQPGPEVADGLAQAQRQAAQKGSPDTAQLVGRTIYLHTPDGYGRSELATLLARAGRPQSAALAGTARNWATVTKLLALCDSCGPRPGRASD